jgi:hypothetical protein
VKARDALFASVLVASFGCRVGIEDREPPPDTAGAQCGVTFAASACDRCARDGCCAEEAACAADSRCAELTSCTVKCAGDDDACIGSCRARHPDGFDENAGRLTTCLSTKCSRACALSCGGYPYPDERCATCARASCCDVARACMDDADCSALVACERACDPFDESCLGLCSRQHLFARDLADAFGSCVAAACPTQCTPARWRCLGTPAPPLPPATSTTGLDVTIDVESLSDTTPFAGVTIRACNLGDQDCAAPLSAPVVTDAKGHVVVHVNPNTFLGYFELVSSDLMPALVFMPMLRSDGYLRIRALSRGAFILVTSSILTVDETRGHIFLVTRDCNDTNAPGVSVTIDPLDAAVRGYVASGAIALGATATGENGFVAFGNVRPYAGITVRASVVDLGKDFPPYSIFVRPGFVSYGQLRARR